MSETKVDVNAYWVGQFQGQEPDVMLSFRVPEHVKNEIDELVFKRKCAARGQKGINLSSFLREAVEEKIARERENEQSTP